MSDKTWYSKKTLKFEIVGEKKFTDTEEELIQAAVFELKEKFRALGVIFDQPVGNGNVLLIDVSYPHLIREKMDDYGKNHVQRKKTLSESDLEAIRKIIKEELDGKQQSTNKGFRFVR